MELSSSFLPTELPWLEIPIVIICALLAYVTLVFVLFREDTEAPIDYTVPLPEQCKPGWKGKTLEEPSIKVIDPGQAMLHVLLFADIF